MAHTAGASLRLGIDEKKFDAVWDYASSPLFSSAERVAIEFTVAASSQPNAVTDELFARMREHWSEDQIHASVRYSNNDDCLHVCVNEKERNYG